LRFDIIADYSRFDSVRAVSKEPQWLTRGLRRFGVFGLSKPIVESRRADSFR
jgi:hypothetical protein